MKNSNMQQSQQVRQSQINGQHQKIFDEQNYRIANQSDLSQILDEDRKKFRQAEQQMRQKADKLQSQKQKLQNQMNDLKYENILLLDNLRDQKQKLEDMAHENANIDQLKVMHQTNIMSQSEHSKSHINKMQQQIEYGAQQYDQMEQQFNYVLQQKDSQHQSQQDQLHKDNKHRQESVEIYNQNQINNLKNLENEIKHLKDKIMEMKIKQEEELKEVSRRTQENEYKKWVSSLKMIEQKLKHSEEVHRQLMLRYNELNQRVQQNDNKIQNLNDQYHNIHQNQQNDIQDKHITIENHQHLLDKCRNDNQQLSYQHSKSQAEQGNLLMAHYANKDQLKCQLDLQLQNHLNERKYIEDINDGIKRRIEKLQDKNNQKEKEYMILKREFDQITNTLQNNLHQTINQTVLNINQDKFNSNKRINQEKATQETQNSRYISKY